MSAARLRFQDYIRFALDRPKSFSFGLFFVAFPSFMMLMLMSVLTAVDQGPASPDLKALGSIGKKASGTVLDTVVDASESMNGVHPILVIYQFNTDKGILRTDTLKTMERKVGPGAQVPVLYSSDDSAIDGVKPFSFPVFVILLIPAFPLVLGSPALIYCLNGVIGKVKLYRSGSEATGKILSMVPIYMGLLPMVSPRFTISFSYPTEDGKEHFNRAIVSDLSIINEYRKGDSIPILVDRMRPEKACIKENLA